MEYKIMLPTAIWQDYDPLAGDFASEASDAEPVGTIQVKDYAFDAPVGDASIRVAMRRFTPSGANGKNLVIVQEYNKQADMPFITELCKCGMTVFVPDISGIGTPQTVFPEAYAYGNIEKAGEHLNKVLPTAKETCQYLYSIIVRRTLAFLEAELNEQTPVLIGLSDAVEVAIQVAGSGGKVKALMAINGSGYREYIKLNKYGGGKELDITEERMCWLSGVASVAYAKNINVPTYIAMGTNSRLSDIDRLENLIALIPTKMVRYYLSPGADGYIDATGFITLKGLLQSLYAGEVAPEVPKAELHIREDGIPRVEVTCDTDSKIEKVKVYFSYGEYNHALRKWQAVDAITVCNGSYICSPDRYNEKGALFAFAEVRYENGITLSSLEEYMELGGQRVRKPQEKVTGILFEPSKENAIESFVDEYYGEVLFGGGKRITTTESGAMGIETDTVGIKTYNVGKQEALAGTDTMQVEIYSNTKQEVSFVFEVDVGDEVKEYEAKEEVVPTQGFFIAHRLEARDFKSREPGKPPLGSWESVKSLKIISSGALIGNILFI